MKYLFLISMAFILSGVTAQNVDSLVMKEVDSVLLISRELTRSGSFNRAIELTQVACKIANDKVGMQSMAFSNCCMQYGVIYYYQGDFAKAEEKWTEAKSIREKILGKEHALYGQTISNLSSLYLVQGMYDKSEAMQLEAIRIMEVNVGKDHSDYASCIGNLGRIYQKMENYKKAEPLLIEALVIRKNKLVEADPALIGNLNDLAGNYYKLANYEKAELLFLKSLEIMERITDTFSQNYLVALGNLGLVYSKSGKYQKAEQLFIRELKIIEALTGSDGVNYCGILINLGNVYEKMGDFEQAKKLFLEAKDIFENRLNNRTNEYYMDCLFSLADLYRQVGNYVEAELLFSSVLEIIIQSWGKRHSYYINAINNLGLLYSEVGDYKKAEQLYIELVDIRKELVGDDPLGYAYSLTNLANIYLEMGNYSKAERNYLVTLKIFENVLGRDHPDYAGILNNLATIYNEWGHMEKAEQLLLEALAIKEASRGKLHPDYAISLTNLGALYFDINRLDDAKVVFDEALSIRGMNLGKTHPDYAQSLNNLGNLNRRIFKPAMAEKFYLEAMEIWEIALGKKSPIYSRNLIGFSTVNAVLGKIQNAEILFNEMTILDRMHITNSLSHLSEKELNLYLKYYSDRQEHVWAFLHYFHGKTSTDVAYDNALFHKGFLLNASKGLNNFPLSDSVMVDKFQLYKSFSRRLANQYSKPISERDSVQVAYLEEKINTIEKYLARSSEGFKEALQQVNWRDVSQQLHQGEAAIEFIHYKYYDFQRDIISDSMMYTALIVLPNTKQPLFIPLFEENELLKTLSKNWENTKPELVSQIYTRGLVPFGRENNQEGLYDLCWKPLDSLLSGIRRIYFSPAGMLHQINFDAIPAGHGLNDAVITLSDKYDLVRLGSTRTLVVPHVNQINATSEIIMFGGIKYDLDTTLTLADTIQIEHVLASSAPSIEYAFRSLPNRGKDWSYLPGTDTELTEITNISNRSHFPVQAFRGSLATEETVKKLGKGRTSPRVLHLATHGFFFPDPEIKSKGIGLDRAEPVFKMSDNPMIRSGLILAGGNYAWQNGRAPRPDMDDGILTAYEISQMNLSNTELVVLSACETGLGDIQGNEGVYGLQRAFKIAGAKYLIMSLWQVPDRETMEFMTTFYKNWLESNMTIPDAFRKTQREMRDRFINPYSWAGFVLVE